MTGTHDQNGNRVMTTEEFFNSLNRGQLVKVGQFGSPLVYTQNWKESMMRHTVFLVTQLLSDPVFVDVENDGSEWNIVVDDNGEPMKMCPDTCYAIDQFVAEWKGSQNLHKVIEKIREENATLRNDIRLINEELNSEADQQNWCNTYEDKLQDLNERLSNETTLVGRLKDRSVQVTVTAQWTVWVDIEATSQEDAEKRLEEMDSDDVYSMVRDVQSYPDDITIDEITS